MAAETNIVPCTCVSWESANCTKLCECSPAYPAAVADLEYASWFPIRPKATKRARQAIYMDPQRVRELAAARGVTPTPGEHP